MTTATAKKRVTLDQLEFCVKRIRVVEEGMWDDLILPAPCPKKPSKSAESSDCPTIMETEPIQQRLSMCSQISSACSSEAEDEDIDDLQDSILYGDDYEKDGKDGAEAVELSGLAIEDAEIYIEGLGALPAGAVSIAS
ncbi:unnamed protein product, partial [Mesorhabditis spiculigera]